MLRKIIAAFLMSSLILSITTPARAGMYIDPNVSELGLDLSENAEIGRMPSVFAAAYNPEISQTWRVCESATDAKCTEAKAINGIANLSVCSVDSQMDCISSVWAVDPAGNKISGTFSKHVPSNSKYKFDENVAMHVPRSDGAGGVWTIPGVKTSAGTESYFVAAQETLNSQKGAGISMSQSKFDISNLLVAIFPTQEVNGSFQLNTPVDSSMGGASYGSNGTQFAPDGSVCASTDTSVCYALRQFPTGYRFGITIHLADKQLGWFHGRFYKPNVTINAWKLGQEISIEAEPVKVPRLNFAVPNKDIPEAVKNLVMNGQEIGMKGDGKSRTLISEFLGSTKTMAILSAFTPAFGDKATSTDTYWSFRTLNGDQGRVQQCAKSSDNLSGLVTTNALTYSAGPPDFDAKLGTLNYKVASPHYEANGDVAEGTYDLSLRSDVARCIYGFTNAPIQAEVSVLSNDGEKKIATTVINERNGWLYLSAKGFTFSSPTIQVKLSQEKPVPLPSAPPTPAPSVEQSMAPAATKQPAKKVTISCVKGKTVKKITAINPKCPAGFKKK